MSRGFSLIEASLSAVIVAVMFAAVIQTVAGARISQSKTDAPRLAPSLLTRLDPQGLYAPQFGRRHQRRDVEGLRVRADDAVRVE